MNMSEEEARMAPEGIRVCQRTVALVVLMSCICLGLSSGGVMAQKSKAPEEALEAFDRNNFDRSSNVDNKWFPLQPGTQWVYKGFSHEDKKRVPVSVVQTVTDLTKVINGVRSVIVWDVDYKDGQLHESEIVFFAQDKDGNVWQLGELRETYDEKEFVGGRPWLAGIDGSSAGIMMKADPQPGTPSYSEGYAPPPYNWTDRGKVERTGQKTCVPAGCYNNVVVIAEGSGAEGPDAQQLKYYAPGVGYIRVGWRGKGEKLKETLELTEVVKLTPEALAKARAEALAIENRAYQYSRTPPAEPMKSESTAGDR
jgi:hypothetical protein